MIGDKVPFWDQRDEFGDTNLLVVKPEEGASLARALGQPLGRADAPPRRDGGRRPVCRNCVFRTIYSCRNAEYQLQAEDARHGQRR